MKKLLLLPLLLGMFLTGCGEETNPGGNTPGGNTPGGDQPVTGTFTFEMSKMGWTSGEENPKVTADPGLTIKAEQGENKSTPPKYWEGTEATDKTLRLYAQNTLTLSANEITKIEFSYTIRDSQTMSPSVGSLSSNIWTGSSSSVTFTLGSKGQIRIIEMKVTGTFSSGGSTPVDPVDPVEDERTTLSVAKDIAFNLFGPDVDYDTDVELYEGDYYVTALSELETAQATVEEGKKYLPDYVELDTDTVEDTQEAGFWYAIYLDVDFDNNGIVVQINSYVDDDNGLLLEYLIYDYWNSL